MCKSLNIIMLGTLCLAATTAGADELFSKFSIGSPFDSGETQGALPSQAAPQRLSGPLSLSAMLTQAGLKPTEVDARIISVTLSAGGSNMPVFMTFNDDYEQIRMVMVLSTLKDGQTVSSDKLIAMMDANRENGSVFFAFNTKQRRAELHQIVENESLTPTRLKAELTAILRAADQSRGIWNIADTAATAPEQSGSASAPAPEATPAPAPTQTVQPQPQPQKNPLETGLIGQWTAARTKTQAFALRIEDGGKFALVTVIDKKTSQSKGKYTLDGTKLTLIDEKGTQLGGTVTLKSEKEFSFQPTGATTPLTFKKAG